MQNLFERFVIICHKDVDRIVAIPALESVAAFTSINYIATLTAFDCVAPTVQFVGRHFGTPCNRMNKHVPR
jgi:hypothetical protein